MLNTATFATLHPWYAPNYWDKRREKPSIWRQIARRIPRFTLIPNQHQKIMDGSLLRGERKLIERITRRRPAYTAREAELLRHLGEGMKLVAMQQGGWRLVKGNRKTRVRAQTVETLKDRGVIYQHPLSKNWLVKGAAA